MEKTKKLTILHSNDFHGDFFEEKVNDQISGGISRLSGYINKVRKENENVLYTISGDMFRGSVIDSEYKGISTINLFNFISPDVVTIGNHEIDYGLAHLLFIEKMAKFPIINANLYIKNVTSRLFKPYEIITLNGIKILFIGIITDSVIESTKTDSVLGSFIDVKEAAKEIERICNNYKTTDIDLTVILTHIGIEEDKELAKSINPICGVDIILGGHSHTIMDQPLLINNILIAQSGHGSDFIGRFDIDLDLINNKIDTFKWELVKINEDCPVDEDLKEILYNYKNQLDSKYERLIAKLDTKLTHPKRNQETSLGNFFADIIKKTLDIDIMLIGSGSIRGESLGPIISLKSLKEIFPYNQPVYLTYLKGKTIKKFALFMLRDESFEGLTEFYQISEGLKIRYSKETKQLLEFSYNNKEITDDEVFSVGIQGFHFKNLNNFMNISFEEVENIKKPRIVSTSDIDLIDEYLSTHNKIGIYNEGSRIIIE